MLNRIENVLGFKLITWNAKDNKFVSPARPDFIWEDNGLRSAKCDRVETHDAPEQNCTCGIYATYEIDVALSYHLFTLNIITLVEAGGKTAVHELGWRSQQMRIVAAISYGDNALYNLGARQAADYYQIPVFDFATAEMVMNMHNTNLLPYYKPTKGTRDYYIEAMAKSVGG